MDNLRKTLGCLLLFLFAAVTSTYAQVAKQYSGTVTDADSNEPVIGVNVTLKDAQTGTVTDLSGKFSISAPVGSTLLFSYIGYVTKEVKLGTNTSLKITMQEDQNQLSEVVVIGYGVVKKSDITGAVASVSSKQFKDQPVKRVEDILQGRTAGVAVTSVNGLPGGTVKVRVRGTTSLNTSNDPLYVIDGIMSGGLDVNPADIQSIEVLKDASATAIYGSRGANGVVLVTTKKGVEGKVQIYADVAIGVSNILKKYDLLNAYEYATALKEYNGISFADDEMEAYKNGSKGIDWQNLMLQTGISQDYKLGISGGTAKNKYLISANVLNMTAMTITTKYQRAQLRINLDNELTKWLTLSTKINASRTHSHNGGIHIMNFLNYSPTMEMKDPETGIYNRDPYNIANGSNPYGELMVNYSDSYSYNLNANLTLLFKIMKGLTFSVQGGYDYDHSPSYSFKSKLEAPGAINSMNNTSNMHNYWQNTNNLTWQRQFGDHNVTAWAVWEISRSWDTGLQGTGSNLNNESVGYWNIANAAIRNASNSYTEASLASGIIRANYDYKKRYFITAALRADGSSKFQGNNKWGYFPSAAVAWDIAKEKFMSNQHILEQLKLRGSFGVTGNQDIAAYSTLGMLSGATYGWGTSNAYTGYWGNQFPTPDITWEKTYQYDLGVDLSLGGFNITFDWFKKITKDLLFQKQVPKYNGGGTYWVNQGELKNTGVEFSVNTFPVKGTVTWETGFNAAYVKNEVTDLAGSDFVLTANYSDLGGAMQIMKPGYPMGSFYVYQWKGFDDKGANLYQKADGSLTTSPTSDDLVVKGQASPKWTMGWNNTISWKNWTLNNFFNAPTGNNRLNISRYTAASMTGNSRFVTLRDAYFKGWDHVSNKAEAAYPSLTNSESKNCANSDFWLEDRQHFVSHSETGCQICKYTIIRKRARPFYNHPLQRNGSGGLYQL